MDKVLDFKERDFDIKVINDDKHISKLHSGIEELALGNTYVFNNPHIDNHYSPGHDASYEEAFYHIEGATIRLTQNGLAAMPLEEKYFRIKIFGQIPENLYNWLKENNAVELEKPRLFRRSQ